MRAPTLARSDARIAAVMAACFTGMVATVAALSALLGASAARATLAFFGLRSFGFAHVPRVPAQVASIFISNLELLLLVPFGMAVIVQARREVSTRHWRRAYVGFCDIVVLAAVLKNAVVIGACVGAFGARMLIAMLPAGPVEIAAFAMAASVYLQARRTETSDALRRLIAPAAVAVGLLALAATLEVFG